MAGALALPVVGAVGAPGRVPREMSCQTIAAAEGSARSTRTRAILPARPMARPWRAAARSTRSARLQIVLTADRKPHEISDIADRLRTRFAWGLLADIERPELEVRIAILRKKAAVESVSLPDDVARWRQVRDLEWR